MPRRLRLATAELGMLELQFIYSYKGVWEKEWEPLQGSFIAELFTTVSKEVADHALHGWTKPLISALGVPPAGALRKLPAKAKVCASLKTCPHSGSECHPAAKKTPWCFDPSGIEGEAKPLANDTIRLWREGVYIVVVENPDA